MPTKTPARKTHVLLLITLILTMLLAACQGSADESVAAYAPAAEADRSDSYDTGGAVSDVAVANQVAAQTQTRLIIRTGDLRLVVVDTEASMAAIRALVEARDGWVVESQVQQAGEAKSGQVTIRVPAGSFDDTMQAIKDLASEVSSEVVSGQDVTEEYVDLTARLANLEATADRVRSFLDDAKTVEDALAINAELSRLEGEIESLKGRIQYLENSAAFSSITVHMVPDALAQPIEIGGWRPAGIARDALEALISALQVLGTILIWTVIVLLPLVMLVLLPVLLIVYLIQRRRRRTAATPAGPDTPAG